MTNLYEILKASKGVPVDDMYTALFGRAVGGGSGASEIEYTGSVPVVIKTDGSPISAYRISGNLVQTGTPTPESPIQPEETGERTGNLCEINGFIGGTTGQKLLQTVVLNAGTYTYSCMQNDTLSSNTRNCLMIRIGQEAYTYESTQSNYHLSAGKHTMTFTVPDDNTSVELRYWINNFSDVCSFDDFMLNTGSTALPYEPYGYKLPVLSGGATTPVYLAEPLRKIGEYADKVEGDTVTRVVKKLVLTGEGTNWANVGGNAPYRIYVDDIIRTTNANAVYFESSHYQAVSNRDSWASYDACMSWAFSGGQSARVLQFRDINCSTLTEFLAFLAAQYAAGTPVTVWYVLATPTSEAITAPTIPTINGEQTFDVDTTLKPSEVYIKYKGEA